MMTPSKCFRAGKWLLACVLAMWISNSNAGAALVMQTDGMIVAGDYRMSMHKDGTINISDPEGLLYDLFFPMSYPGGDSKETKQVKLKDPKVTVDEKAKTVTFSGVAQPPNGKPFNVQTSMAITPEGRVRVSLKGVLDQPVGQYLGFRGDLHVGREALVGGVIAVGDQKFPIQEAKPSEGKVLKQGPAETVVLNAGNPQKQISFIPVVQGGFSVQDRNVVCYRAPFIAMTFDPKGGELTYDVQLPSAPSTPKSPDTYAGIDFWKNNRLHMPQYNQSRNLIQNPSFEAGFAYWHWASLGRFPKEPKYDEYSEISTEQPQSGKRCLALRGEVGQGPAEIATFAIPVEKDQEYTWSFYARSSKGKGRLNINAQGYFTPPFMVWKTVEVTGPEWKRYTFTFKTTHSVLNVSLGNAGSQEDDWVYVDSVQLEKGTQATEFTTKPVLAWVSSDFRGNLWEPGNDPKAVLHVSGKPGTAGKVAIKESDFFGKETDRGTVDYQLDPAGEASIPLPWAAKLPLGTHVINLDVATPDGFNGKDTGRFTVMRFLKNEHKNKNLFSAHLGNMTGSWKRQAEFFKRVGLGSTILFDPCSHQFHKILEDNGILHFSSILDAGQGFKKQMGWDQHENGFDLSPEQLKQIEELCYQKAKEYPEVKYWKLNNEPDCGPFIDNIPKMNTMVDALIAARKGTLRANPEAVLIGSDPANMYASSGIAFVNTQLEAIGDRKVYDIPAIHPYRERPEAPDRDAETKLFLNMVDRHGYHGDVWFTEGIYHQNYIVPEWSLNTHKACSTDHFRGGALSYDMGWGERMAAAYAARSWLVSLKYGDRVKLDIDWGFSTNSSSDVDFTPGAISFATNTLGSILGNATFKADLSLGYEVRCYIFQDEKQRPVAAIWYHNIESDKGKTLGPMLDVSALVKANPKLNYADFMGNPHLLKENVQLGPFPIFIRGTKGSTGAFIESLGQASLVDDKGALFASITVQSPTQALIQVDNSINKPFSGTAKLLKGKEVVAEEKITIPAKKSWSRVVDEPFVPNALSSTSLTLELTPAGKTEATSFELKQSVMAWPKRKNPITFTGNVQEWQSAFQIPIVNRIEFGPYGLSPEKRAKYKEHPVAWKGPEDLSATMYGTWDEENLYLAFAVKDDVLNPNPKPEMAWNGDSIQLYFDGWADARKHREMGYGPDDQTFAIWPHLPDSVIRREVTPERQLAFLDAGPVKTAHLKVTRNEGVTFYELALPLKDLNPVQLKAGEKFGFAPLINDDDNDYRKRALSLTPAGTQPSDRPDLFPTVILVP